MVKHLIDSQYFDLYACLPFVELAHESTIQLGPVLFWPASKSKEFLPIDHHSSFQAYMKVVGQIKVQSQQKGHFVNTTTLNPKGSTCVSIAENIPKELREFVLIEALYLLYFACTFRNLYYGQEIPSFNAFRKMIPASSDFISVKQNWENLYIDETNREETICLNIIDQDICQGLGKALNAIYIEAPSSQEQDRIQAYKRLVRAIRYLVDRFFQRFVNLFGKGLDFSKEIFEPEDVIFLASSFETLFNINDKHPAADFKHKLRPLLHLKYSKPVEMFWKWVDDFYEVKRRILHGDTLLDPLFRLNPNFEISHILLGIKLLIYAIYYKLYKFQLVKSTHVDLYTPPDFKWIHPEEILIFFWSESTILLKLNRFIKQLDQDPFQEEHLADIHLLTNLFVSLYERYYLEEQLKGEGIVRFIPTPLADLTSVGTHIIQHLKSRQVTDAKRNLEQVIHPHFVRVLEERLQDTSF